MKLGPGLYLGCKANRNKPALQKRTARKSGKNNSHSRIYNHKASPHTGVQRIVTIPVWSKPQAKGVFKSGPIEITILSEVNQTEKDKYHMISLICGI